MLEGSELGGGEELKAAKRFAPDVWFRPPETSRDLRESRFLRGRGAGPGEGPADLLTSGLNSGHSESLLDRLGLGNALCQ